jgi:anti-repressor protein
VSNIQVFNFKLFQIRTVMHDNEPWFIACDVCNALELGNTAQAVSRIDDYEKAIISNDTLGGGQSLLAVSEPGLYALVLGSKKVEAREFKRWITHEVLPSIRKHGMYATPDAIEKFLADPDTMIKTLQAFRDERAARVQAEKQLKIAAPKVEGFDKLMSSEDCVSVGEVAKLLGTGQNRLFDFLRYKKVLISDNNLPYQPHIDAGRFKIIEQTWGKSKTHLSSKTLVTPKGIEYIRKIWETVGAN